MPKKLTYVVKRKSNPKGKLFREMKSGKFTARVMSADVYNRALKRAGQVLTEETSKPKPAPRIRTIKAGTKTLFEADGRVASRRA